MASQFVADSGEGVLSPDDLLGYPYVERVFGAPGVRRPLLLELPFLPFVFSETVGWGLRDIAVYDFDPNCPNELSQSPDGAS